MNEILKEDEIAVTCTCGKVTVLGNGEYMTPHTTMECIAFLADRLEILELKSKL